MAPAIACIGGLTLDWLEFAGGRLGPTPGGNALYTAVGAWLASANPMIVARVGRDYPANNLSAIASGGLSTEHIRPIDCHTYRVLISGDQDRREVRYLEGSGTNRSLDCDPSQIPDCDFGGVHVCPAEPSHQLAILRRSRERGLTTTLDVLFVEGELEPTQSEVLEMMPYAQAFLPSRSEIERLWPSLDPVSCIRCIQGAGCNLAVVKMGAAGSLGSDGRVGLFIPPVRAKVVDATGAGDAFCGAFHAKWMTSQDLALSMAWGAAAASIVIEGFGALHALRQGARRAAEARSEIALKQLCKRLDGTRVRRG